MTKTSDEKSSKLKPYQMILLSCLLAAFMIINSNNVNYNRDLAKLNKEKGELFDRIIKTRRLSSSSSQTYSAEICERGSDDLKEYYQTGDPKIIDIDPNEGIKCEDKDETYMKALINIVRTMADDTEEESDGGRRNLRNLGGVSDIDQQDLTDYGMRFLPMAVFLVFGILSIFGWIFCCICCCCDCCCCCCLKKTSCKVPCFIFTYVFYGLVVGISLYGLIQSNKIFVSLSDTECSILKFFEQVLNGEIKQSLPRWAGIERIKGILFDIKTRVTSLSGDVHNELNEKMNHEATTIRDSGLIHAKELFKEYMEDVGYEFYEKTAGVYKTPYKYETNYIYDMVFNFGMYIDDSQGYRNPSYLLSWNEEFSAIDGAAYGYLTNAQTDFDNILGTSGLGTVTRALDDGIKNLGDLTSPFTDANEEIGKLFSNFSESIDSYGKMSVKIIFGGLMAMNLALAALMLLICMFSGKSCTSCCCCRCLFKFCTHILWNVLALLMILSFIFGSLIALVGRLGGDAMGLVSYIMSKENFRGDKLLINKLGDAQNYIYTCMHDDGNIARELGLGTSLNSFTRINDLENKISNIINNFTQAKGNKLTYNYIDKKFQDQKAYKEDISLIKLNGEVISYFETIREINDILEGKDKKERWSTSETAEPTCQTAPSEEDIEYYSPKCKPKDISYYYDDNANNYPNYKEKADFLDYMDKVVIYSNDENPHDTYFGGTTKRFIKVVEELRDNYDDYLSKYEEVLTFFLGKIREITVVIRPFIGNGEAFSFINGKFIGINLQIVLKYLKHSLGGDFFTVGICLCVVGLSLILSISSTIILIVIINIGLKEAIEQNKMLNNPGTAVSPFEGVPNMPKPPY